MRAFLRPFSEGDLMITIRNFNEAYQQYKADLISYRLLQEQVVVMLDICGKSTDALGITNQHIQWLTQQAESDMNYMDLLGGDMHICSSVKFGAVTWETD